MVQISQTFLQIKNKATIVKAHSLQIQKNGNCSKGLNTQKLYYITL